MAAPSLVHFGVDPCFRLPVLRSAGFQTVECQSMDEFSLALASHPDAVVFEEDPDRTTEQAIVLAHSQTNAPMVLFAAEPCLQTYRVDLVIPAFTTPELWLNEIRKLIALTHQTIAQAQALREQPAPPARDSTASRESSRVLREWTAQERKQVERHLTEMRKRSGE